MYILFVGKKTLTDLVPGAAFEPVNVYNMLQVIEANKSFKVSLLIVFCVYDWSMTNFQFLSWF